MTRRQHIFVWILAAACGDDDAPTSGSGEASTSGGDRSTTGDIGGCRADETQCESSSSTEAPPTDLPPTATCGDGVVDDGEQCDDANAIDDDECSNGCVGRCGLIGESSFGLGTGESDAITSITVAADGTVWVGGSLNASGNGDAWFAKLGPDGDEIWSRTYNHGYGIDIVRSMVPMPDGGVVVAAVVDGPMDRDIWLGRHDANGEPSWTTLIDDSDEDIIVGAAASGEQIVLVGGVRVSEYDTDVRVIAFDAEGSIVWERLLDDYGLGTSSRDYATGMAVRPTGEIVVLADVEVDYETIDSRVIELAADGTGPTFDVAPLPAFTAHQHNGCGVAIAADGRTYAAIAAPRGAIGSMYRIFELDAMGATIRETGAEELGLEPGGHRCTAIAIEPSGHLAVLGTRPGMTGTVDLLEVLHLDADLEVACYGYRESRSLETLPATVGIAPDAAKLYVGGGKILGGAVQPWLARFRG